MVMLKFSNYYLGRVCIEFFSNLKILINISANKLEFFSLFLFSFFVIGLEIYSLSIFYTVSNLTLNENYIYKNYYLDFFNLISKTNNIHPIIFLFIFIFLKNIFVIFFLIYKNVVLLNFQRTISLKIINSILNQEYVYFIKQPSSKLIAIMQQDTSLLMRNYSAVLNILIESILLIFIFFYIFNLNTKISLFLIVAIITYFIFYIIFTKARLIKLSHQRNYLNQSILKDLQQTFANFREFIIYNSRKIFFLEIGRKYKKFFSNLKIGNILQETSKVFIEQVFIIAILLIMIFINFSDGSNTIMSIIPLLTVYLFAFIKVLPSFNKIVIETQSYIYTKLFVKKINDQLKNCIVAKKLKNTILDFSNSIEVKNISFKWEETENTLFENLNLIIAKDSKIGIIGKSGSGKTTFLNLLMGFVIPNKGEILVDNKNIEKDLFEWRKKIAYVSQSNYMLDESLLKNITFQSDINNIDKELLNNAIYYSGLIEFIKNVPLGINTLVGERGSKISGGEILRIALARAYYSKKEIFILDEFTSALDNETENKILDNLDIQKKTIIMVSHKKSALKNCDRIYELTRKGFLFL